MRRAEPQHYEYLCPTRELVASRVYVGIVRKGGEKYGGMSKSGDALHLPFMPFLETGPLFGVLFKQELAPEVMHAPPQLTVTKVFLTDNPYENQLGLLRWIRTLLSEVVDKAASQSEDDQDRHHQQQEQLAGSVREEVDEKEGCALGAPTPEEKREDHGASSAISISKSERTQEVLEESRRCVDDVQTDVAMPRAPTDSITKALEESGTAVSASSRKRPRNVMHGQDLFGVGSVVECYHQVSREVHTDKCHRIYDDSTRAGSINHCRATGTAAAGNSAVYTSSTTCLLYTSPSPRD